MQITLHGDFLEIFSAGVLLTGNSGIGKSECALSLISRQHQLIADDIVFISEENSKLIGTCPELLQDFLEIRGVGVLNIRKLFGDKAISHSAPLDLVIHLTEFNKKNLRNLDRLQGLKTTRTILGHVINEITLPVAPGRNLAVLIECAVRNYQLKQNGYDAVAEFIKQQQQAIEK